MSEIPDRAVVPRSKCPGNRRGHTWQELPPVHPSRGGWTSCDLSLRKCARCGVLGRVNKQGVINLVEGP